MKPYVKAGALFCVVREDVLHCVLFRAVIPPEQGLLTRSADEFRMTENVNS